MTKPINAQETHNLAVHNYARCCTSWLEDVNKNRSNKTERPSTMSRQYTVLSQLLPFAFDESGMPTPTNGNCAMLIDLDLKSRGWIARMHCALHKLLIEFESPAFQIAFCLCFTFERYFKVWGH